MRAYPSPALLLLFWLLSGSAIAAPAPLDCTNPATTLAMLECTGREYELADAELNRVYQRQQKFVDSTGRGLLRDAQRRWIRFRDAECERSADLARGGTLAGVLHASCLVDLTRERIAQLQQGTLEGAPDAEFGKVFWRDQRLLGRFSCSDMEQARVGLLPRFNPDLGEWHLIARVQIGERRLDFPIGGETQDALCGHDLTLELEGGGECPGLRLDDGMCDAFHLRWEQGNGGFVWGRE